jgi:hypothetical protein
MHRNAIDFEDLTGTERNKRILIPRKNLTYSGTILPFNFQRSQFPIIAAATGIVPQSLFKNLKILDLENTLVVEIQKGILLYSCHIVRKFLNIDTEHKTQKSQNVEARRR